MGYFRLGELSRHDREMKCSSLAVSVSIWISYGVDRYTNSGIIFPSRRQDYLNERYNILE